MAGSMSKAAIQFALEDAKADIAELLAQMERLKWFARVIAYPRRGTHEEGFGLMDMAKIAQSTWKADDLSD